MGSKMPPDGQKELEHSESLPDRSKRTEELERLLKIKEQEIRSLKFELEKYKLALRQSQQVAHQGQQQDQLPISHLGTATEPISPGDYDQASASPLDFAQRTETSNYSACAAAETIVSDVIGQLVADQEEISDTLGGEAALAKESPSHSEARVARHSTASIGSATSSSGRFLFKAGTDDEDDKEPDANVVSSSSHHVRTDCGGGASRSDHGLADLDDDDEDADDNDEELYSVIQDVGEIDLNKEIRRERKRRRRLRALSLNSDIKSIDKDDSAPLDVGHLCDEDQDQEEKEDEDIISGNLLTSLTDAAISNLSQLAALQERCESEDSVHQQEVTQTSQPQVSTSMGLYRSHHSTTVPAASIVSTASIAPNSTCLSNRDLHSYDPFSASSIANQAALAISAAAASSSLLAPSPTDSLSPSSTIHADLSSGQSLASVVAAAAVAAAADQEQKQQNDHPHQAHQLQSTPQSRLMSSALSSPEFYQNLHQQHRTHLAQQQAGLPHQMSPMSALHAYSPTPAMSPSPSTLLAHSRRSDSNASSSFMSPISSPSYLRRQYMTDRLPSMMSPSPSLTRGSSSAASGSLAHILQQHQHHHQQRSASALAGSVTSSSGTPLSGTGSSVMSPLVGSKSSSQARLNNMQIRHKFGYLGSGRGQFNSPHGFCLGLNQEIVVADTNNHRICIFDKSGSYITEFGSAGKEEGQLWNPRKVAILHRTPGSSSAFSGSGPATLQRQVASSYPSHFGGGAGSSGGGSTSSTVQNTSSGTGQLLASNEPLYVVCDRGAERSRMQLFTKDGSFIKKIGIHYIDIVAGLAITQNGLIIVVDSVSPTVYIINADTGTLNGWFDCSGHMKEPSDIAVKSEVPGNEYFICDFKGHCVVVFNEQGEYLRKIGHDGLTSYPNGIDISDDGDILVGDSHGNRFHVVVFDRNGNFVSQFECPHVKVSRCCGLKITREGYIVTLAKNNHHVLVLDTIHI